MVIRPAKGAPTTVDYRERAPLKSTQTMYSIHREDRAPTHGDRVSAPGVPAPSADSRCAQKFGKLSWKDRCHAGG